MRLSSNGAVTDVNGYLVRVVYGKSVRSRTGMDDRYFTEGK